MGTDIHSAPQDGSMNQHTTSSSTPAPARRPRVKVVSSRFMTPVAPPPLSHQPRHPLTSPKCSFSRQPDHSKRSLSVPRSHQSETTQHFTDENGGGHAVAGAQEKKRAVRPLFRDITDHHHLPPSDDECHPPKPPPTDSRLLHWREKSTRNFRPGTPMVSVSTSTTSRSSVATQRPQTQRRPAATAALQLVRSSGMAAGRKPVQEDDASHPLSSSGSNCGSGVSDGQTEDDDACSISNHGGGGDAGGGGFCDSPPIPNVQGGGGCKGGRSVSELRSSMPEADVLLTMSTRSAARPNLTSGDPIPASRRSLNATLMSCHQSYDPSNTGRIALPKPPSTASRHQPGSIRASMLCLPPHPSNAKVGTESRRGVKASTHQEDIHSLRMLYNRHLQWKFANTKAEAAMRAQKIAAEKSLYGMCVRISGLQNSVTTKRSELEQLKNQKNLYTILETQMTYLDEWSILEEDYTSSISGLIKALRDAIIRLPVTGDVRVDPSEIDLILKSATNIMDALASNVGSCLPKAGGVDNVFSGLARVVSDERAAIEECRDLLSQVQKLQLEECSLRSELVQLHRRTEMGICDPLRG